MSNLLDRVAVLALAAQYVCAQTDLQDLALSPHPTHDEPRITEQPWNETLPRNVAHPPRSVPRKAVPAPLNDRDWQVFRSASDCLGKIARGYASVLPTSVVRFRESKEGDSWAYQFETSGCLSRPCLTGLVDTPGRTEYQFLLESDSRQEITRDIEALLRWRETPLYLTAMRMSFAPGSKAGIIAVGEGTVVPARWSTGRGISTTVFRRGSVIQSHVVVGKRHCGADYPPDLSFVRDRFEPLGAVASRMADAELEGRVLETLRAVSPAVPSSEPEILLKEYMGRVPSPERIRALFLSVGYPGDFSARFRISALLDGMRSQASMLNSCGPVVADYLRGLASAGNEHSDAIIRETLNFAQFAGLDLQDVAVELVSCDACRFAALTYLIERGTRRVASDFLKGLKFEDPHERLRLQAIAAIESRVEKKE
ncbi:MAG: hypothetical protein JNL98_13675 [Bryobacterales bacterium]|nr:hypothetical protein [Bryobacterales bacterium]